MSNSLLKKGSDPLRFITKRWKPTGFPKGYDPFFGQAAKP